MSLFYWHTNSVLHATMVNIVHTFHPKTPATMGQETTQEYLSKPLNIIYQVQS